MNDSLELLGHRLVSLAHDYIEHGLRAHDLRGGSDKRRIANVRTDSRDLLQHLGQLIQLPCLCQLAHQVGEHSAGHLVKQSVHVHLECLRIEQTVGQIPLAQRRKILGNTVELAKVDAGIVLCTCEGSNESLRGGLRSTHSHGRNCCINYVNACLDSLKKGHRCKTCGVVCVKHRRLRVRGF